MPRTVIPQPLQVLHAAFNPAATGVEKPRLAVVGATGALGSEVLHRLAGNGGFSHTVVMAREPITTGLAQVGIALVPPAAPEEPEAPAAPDIAGGWPLLALQGGTAVVMFEPPRLYYDRERALWTPAPAQLLSVARWLRRCGVVTLAVVVPHARGRLPEALKRGLANLDEQGVAALGFERLLLVRSAQKATEKRPAGFLHATAAWMLSTLNYMVPDSEQPVRPTRLAEFIDEALRMLPPGAHVAAPELLWRAGQKAGPGATRELVRAWLAGRTPPPASPVPSSPYPKESP